MGSEDKKCLFCFPLECGVATIAILCACGCVCIGWTAQTTENGWATYGVNFASVIITVLSFAYAYAAPSEQARKIVFLVWIIFICIVTRVWYTYVILNGSVWEQICNEGAVEAVSPIGIVEAIPTEDCVWGGKRAIWADHIGGWMFDIYFAFVIQRWSQNDDGYQAQQTP